MTPTEYLKLPYARVLTPDVTGGFVATMQEFPGCIAEGETADEAYQNLERAAESWIEGAIESKYPIPEPLADHLYSGRVALRLPKSLHRKAAELAEVEGTSINQLLVSAIAEYMGTARAMHRIEHRINLLYWERAQSSGASILPFHIPLEFSSAEPNCQKMKKVTTGAYTHA